MNGLIYILSIIGCYAIYVESYGLNPRIIGGNQVNIQQYPYQLSVQKNNKHICGGAIISANWALTAAQCLNGATSASITIRAGSSSAASGGTIHKAGSIISHKDFNKGTKLNDIALIKVTPPFELSKPGYGIIDLPLVDEDVPAGKDAFLTGYGLTSASSTPTYILQGASLPIIAEAVCKKAAPALAKSMVCAGFITGGRDACSGDEGSPLVLNKKFVGITSWNFSCGKSGVPTVFTKISAFRTWIKQNSGV